LTPRRALVVVPARDEAATITSVVTAIRAVGLPCLVVDDHSDDDTEVLARAAGARVLRLPVHLGVGGALRLGFRFAVSHGYEVAVQCDADGQHPPELIPQLLDAQARTGAHLLIGSRFVGEGTSFPIGWARRVTMRMLSGLVRLRSGQHVADTTSGFRCIAEPLLSAFSKSFPTHYLGDTFEAVLVAARAGYRVAEEPVRMEAREVGRSTASLGGALRSVVRAVVVAVGGLTFRIDRLADVAPAATPAEPLRVQEPSPPPQHQPTG
jgi:glycosyltransferase involved in cell wall biosynthesis